MRTLGNFVDLLDEGGDKAASELLLRERAERAERRAADIRSAEGGNTDEEGDEAEAKVGTAEVVSGEVAEEEEGAEDGDDTPRGSAEYRAALAASSKSRSRLAGVLLSHGKTFEAEAEYVKALDQADAAHGVKNAEAAAVAGALAHCYRKQGKLAQAEPLLERLLECTCSALGEEHLQTAAVANSLATLHREQCKYSVAEPLHARAVTAAKAAAGDVHPMVADLLVSQALTLKALGRTKVAKRCVDEASKIRQATQQMQQAQRMRAKLAAK